MYSNFFNKALIFSNDGGGMRGLYSSVFYRNFANLAGFNQTDFHKVATLLSGTSTGGIISLGLAFGLTPQQLIDFYINDGPLIFYPPVSTSQKILTLLYGDETYYQNTVLKQKLESVFGDALMSDLKTNVLIPSLEITTGDVANVGADIKTIRPVYYSNIKFPGLEGQNKKIVDVALSTSAAPLYLPPIPISSSSIINPNADKKWMIDGGLFCNNPSLSVFSLINALFTSIQKISICSVGTGLGNIGLFDPQPITPPQIKQFLFEKKGLTESQAESHVSSVIPNFENIYLLLDCFSASLTGSQEHVHQALQILSYYGTKVADKDFYYYRFNSILDSTKDTDLDTTTPEFLTYMQSVSDQQFATDKFKISAFIDTFKI
jgi:predicted acylesterase/phospholipase RssA